MKFKSECSGVTLPVEMLEQDCAQARPVGRVRLGEQCMFFRKFAGTTYLPYGQIVQAWLRQEEVRARMCCATTNFDQFYLVMRCAEGQECRWHIDSKEDGQTCLDHIAAQKPSVRIGYKA